MTVWVFQVHCPEKRLQRPDSLDGFQRKQDRTSTQGMCFQLKSSNGFSNSGRTSKVGAAKKGRKSWMVSNLKPLAE